MALRARCGAPETFEWSKEHEELAGCFLEHMEQVRQKSSGASFTRAHLDAIAADDELFDRFETAWGHGG